MNIKTKNDYFTYSIIENILTEEENIMLFEICDDFGKKYSNSIEDSSYFILPENINKGIDYCKENGLIWQNTDVTLSEEDWLKFYKLREILKTRLTESIITNDYPLIDSCEWYFNLRISSNMDLNPHTDDPIQAEEFGKLHNINVTRGLYKGVIYIGNPNYDYSNYGTRMYKNIEKNSEIEEILFVPKNACIFKASENSWHGTDFKGKLTNNRFTITYQYH
jgi:hypothetical protein